MRASRTMAASICTFSSPLDCAHRVWIPKPRAKCCRNHVTQISVANPGAIHTQAISVTGWDDTSGKRGGGIRAAVSAGANSAEELKRRGDSYFALDKRPILLFDGVCNMCNGGVNIVLDNDPEGRLRFAALQSEAGRALLARSGRAVDDISSVVLVDEHGAYIKSEAVLKTCAYLGFPLASLAMAAAITPLFFRDSVYDQVANNRYSLFGRSSSCRLSDPKFEARFISS